MKKEKIKRVVKEIILFALQIVFSNIIFLNRIRPIGFAFSVVRLFYGSNLMLVTIEFGISNILWCLQIQNLFIVFYEIVVLSLYYFSKEFIKTKKQLLLILGFTFLSEIISIYYVLKDTKILLEVGVNLAVKMILVLYLKKLFADFKKKFVFYSVSNFDYFMLSIFVLLVCMGLFNFEFILNKVSYFIICLFILFLGRVFPKEKLLIISIIVSLSFVFLGNLNALYFCLGLSLLTICISNINKILYFLITETFGVLLLFLLKDLTVLNLCLSALSSLILIILPQKIYFTISEYFVVKSGDLIFEGIQNEKNDDVKLRLKIMSKTLSCMQSDFKQLIVGNINRNSASRELAKDLFERCCVNCPNFSLCESSNVNKSKLFSDYILYAIQNGELTDNLLGMDFKVYCAKTNELIDEINHISKQYLSFEEATKKEDESKFLISSELGNFANLFNNFEKILEKSSKINKNMSNIAKDVLSNNMIDIQDIAFLENERGLEEIKVVADNSVVLRREMVESLNRVVKNGVALKKLKHLELSGMSLATFVPNNLLKAEFAVSSRAKNGFNGDNVTITKMENGKFFIALADGMGHGKSANRISGMVLNLIRSFFAVGIDTDLIIESVNNLLIPAGLNCFSTLDACVVDLNLKVCTFIKLGASISILKHKEKSEIICGDSLPVGIVKNVKPTIIQKRISEGDIIFIASDGVVDSFNNPETYKIFINDAKIYNLQKYVDDVVSDLNASVTEHKDDMSIIAINLLKNS